MRPRLLDLFCGAGGCSVGYHRAGFDVVGVDINPQPRYPFPFFQDDALEFIKTVIRDGCDFDVIHASPPCQAWSVANNQKRSYPELIEPVRNLMEISKRLYVIENVPAAPLRSPIILCGLSFPSLNVKRHRAFESNVTLMSPGCGDHRRDYLVIFGHECRSRRHGKAAGRKNKLADGRIAMDIDWMTRGELSQAIPPAYTEYIGRQLIRHLKGWRNDE